MITIGSDDASDPLIDVELLGEGFIINSADPNICFASTGFADGGRLYTVDTGTGAATLVGDITNSGAPVSAVPGLAVSPDGTLFGTTSGIANLLKIDAASGAGFSLGGTTLASLEAIAFDLSGVLFGLTFGGSLVTIDTATVAITTVGSTGSSGWAGMAFDPADGTLFASRGGFAADPDGIYTINPATAVPTKIGDTGLGGATPDLHFDNAGTLFGSKGGGGSAGDLITINKATAAGTVIGSFGVASVSGLGSFPDPPPPLVFRVERATGNVFAKGSFFPGGADLAERILVSEPVAPGDVVELDPANPLHYRKARGSSQLIAGIITTEPGFILGNRLDETDLAALSPVTPEVASQPMLALMGRVPVNATTENGPIRPGDLLTVASKPGYVMRCDQLKECAIIGKALEGLERGEGRILVLVMAH